MYRLISTGPNKLKNNPKDPLFLNIVSFRSNMSLFITQTGETEQFKAVSNGNFVLNFIRLWK